MGIEGQHESADQQQAQADAMVNPEAAEAAAQEFGEARSELMAYTEAPEQAQDKSDAAKILDGVTDGMTSSDMMSAIDQVFSKGLWRMPQYRDNVRGVLENVAAQADKPGTGSMIASLFPKMLAAGIPKPKVAKAIKVSMSSLSIGDAARLAGDSFFNKEFPQLGSQVMDSAMENAENGRYPGDIMKAQALFTPENIAKNGDQLNAVVDAAIARKDTGLIDFMDAEMAEQYPKGLTAALSIVRNYLNQGGDRSAYAMQHAARLEPFTRGNPSLNQSVRSMQMDARPQAEEAIQKAVAAQFPSSDSYRIKFKEDGPVLALREESGIVEIPLVVDMQIHPATGMPVGSLRIEGRDPGNPAQLAKLSILIDDQGHYRG
jgi:hypothetical protein